MFCLSWTSWVSCKWQSASTFKALVPEKLTRQCTSVFYLLMTPLQRISTLACTKKYITYPTRSTPSQSKHPSLPQLVGCSSLMSTHILPFLLRSWKGSYCVCSLTDLPLSWDSNGRTSGMAPRIPSPGPPSQPLSQLCYPLPQPKFQLIKAVHVKVAKEYKDIAADLVCKALHSTAFHYTTNLMMKLVPL